MTLRKRIIPSAPVADQHRWLSIEEIAEVEVSSEDPEWPIDGALILNSTRGWRASHPGAQTVRIRFETPRVLRLIHLDFNEPERERVQEFALSYSSDGGSTSRTLLRQQFSFSPAGATRETEDYGVELTGVTDLQLQVVPDVSGRPTVATLAAMRLR